MQLKASPTAEMGPRVFRRCDRRARMNSVLSPRAGLFQPQQHTGHLEIVLPWASDSGRIRQAWDSGFWTSFRAKTIPWEAEISRTLRIETTWFDFWLPFSSNYLFIFYAHTKYTPAAYSTVHLKNNKKKRRKTHQACLSNATVFYALLSCQWK